MENPKIRFKGFTKDWEQRKLSDVLDIVTKRNGEKYGKEEVLSVSDEYGCINQIKFQGRSFAGEDISNYKIVDTGDIIYTRSPLKSKPYGIIKVVGDEIGIVSPLYIVNKVKEGNNSQFIYRVFDSPEKTNKYLSPLVRKGAKNTMNISNDEWLSGKIDVAPSYEEQYQIGLYFDHLDHFITLHQRKCEQTKKLKKYMLQKMFPQNGAKVPEIRFDGFTYDWEQRKLGDVAEFSKGNGYSKGDLIESGTPIILYGRLYTKYETIISEVDTYVEAKEGSVYSKGGEVIVPASGETAEDIARAATVDKSGILLGGDLNVVMPNKDINPAFLAISISNGNSQRELSKKAQGKSVVHIHNEEIRNLVIPFPNKVEQNKIVAYFANLDHLITLHQRKCDELKKMKKYMLQNMFI